MPTALIKSERRFQIWKYTVSHSELLVRSTKSTEFSTRIDVFFKGVTEFHLPTIFTGLSVVEVSDAVAQKLCILRQAPCLSGKVKIFKIQGNDFVGYVVALIALSHEDEGEYDAPSFFAKDNLI